MELERLDPSVVWLWRVQSAIGLVWFWAPLSVAVGVGIGVQLALVPGVLAGVLLFVSRVILAFVWPAVSWRYFGYAVRDDDLLVQRGVLFRRRSSVPHNRIQHVDTRQGPIERLFGVSRLLVFTASGVAADASLPGIDEDRAESLRDELSRRGGDDGV